MEIEEIWKDVKNYEGLYQVSNMGNVKSLNYQGKIREKILKPGSNNKGYQFYNLYKEGKVANIFVHRLVCQAFKGLDITDKKEVVLHLDNNPANNNLSNLEVGDQSENILQAYRENRMKSPKAQLGKFGKDNHLSKQVAQFTLENEFIRVWDSMSDIERELGIYHGSISACCTGQRNKAGGYKWIFNTCQL